MQSTVPSGLSDADLVAEVKRLAGSARVAAAALVAHLAEMERRQLHLGAGYPSLFAYCTAVLRLSEYEAYGRVQAARAIRSFPRVLDMLGEGSLTLTTAQLLARNLTRENQAELLPAAAGKSKWQVQELLARHVPMPDAPPTVRKLPPPRVPVATDAADPPPPPAGSPAEPRAGPPVPCPTVPAPVVAGWALPPPRYRPAVTPLAPERYQITFTASAHTREKLRCAQDLLRHAVPSGDTAEVIDRALTVLLDDLARKKFAATDRPRASQGQAEASRHVPAGVKRAVWVRDAGRCAFVAESGRRCEARGFLEFHHVEPYARGGQPTIANIELRCAAHNAYEAELQFGPRRPSGEGTVHESRVAYTLGRPARGHPSRNGLSLGHSGIRRRRRRPPLDPVRSSER